jgi:heavy metal sensor kinase
VLTAPIEIGSIQIGAPLDEYYEMLDDFTWTALLASPLMMLLAAAGGYWMSRRALAPVDLITSLARDIGARDLSRRLPLRGAADELDRLSTTLNEMLSRLESAFERITRFTADASHEMRTPIAVVRTTAELARSRPRTPEEYERALDRILLESERVSALIEDLMLLARAGSGADCCMTSDLVDLAAVLREVCGEAHVLAESRGLILDVCVLPEATVRGDAAALHRLILILLDNAIKYTPAGGRIQVSMGASEGRVCVAIQDTGTGISSEDLPHVFDRFYRASKDRSRRDGGTGLGLAIAQWIAVRHDGEVRVESEVNAGSTFTIFLPAVSALLQNAPAE